MKTAMQELIDYFNERPEYDKTSEGYEIIEKAKQLLEKEKDQLYHSFYAGGGVTVLQDFKEEFDKYYKEVFECE